MVQYHADAKYYLRLYEAEGNAEISDTEYSLAFNQYLNLGQEGTW